MRRLLPCSVGRQPVAPGQLLAEALVQAHDCAVIQVVLRSQSASRHCSSHACAAALKRRAFG